MPLEGSPENRGRRAGLKSRHLTPQPPAHSRGKPRPGPVAPPPPAQRRQLRMRPKSWRKAPPPGVRMRYAYFRTANRRRESGVGTGVDGPDLSLSPPALPSRLARALPRSSRQGETRGAAIPPRPRPPSFSRVVAGATAASSPGLAPALRVANWPSLSSGAGPNSDGRSRPSRSPFWEKGLSAAGGVAGQPPSEARLRKPERRLFLPAALFPKSAIDASRPPNLPSTGTTNQRCEPEPRGALPQRSASSCLITRKKSFLIHRYPRSGAGFSFLYF